jgi:tol-pal system protein YbgF
MPRTSPVSSAPFGLRSGPRRGCRGHVVLALAFAASSVACSTGKSAEDRQLDQLREEITRVQSDSDKFEERLDKLEVGTADLHPDPSGKGMSPSLVPARAISAPIATPRLRVVHLGADGTEEAGSAGETAAAVGGPDADDGTRVRIQGSGREAVILNDKGAKPKRAQDGATGSDTVSFTNANIGSALASHSSSRGVALDEDAKHAYDAALGLVNAKHYPEALEALAGFLVRWPDHPNADNAMYWRGECYFAQGDYASAAKEFDGLVARFPTGNKAPDALLKLGISAQRQGDSALARQQFDRLRHDFPRSDAAKHIPASARSTSGDKP